MKLLDIVVKKDDAINYTASLQEVFDKMHISKIEYVVLLRNDLPFGIITKNDIINFFQQNGIINTPLSAICTRDIVQISKDRDLDFAYNLITSFNFLHFILVDEDGKYAGVVKKCAIMYHVRLEEGICDKKLKDIEFKKSTFIETDANINKVLNVMNERKCASLLIGKENNIQGIISNQNIMHYISLKSGLKTVIKDIEFMQTHIVSMDDSVKKVLKIMNENDLRDLIAFDEVEKIYYSINVYVVLKAIQTNHERFLHQKIQTNHSLLDNVEISIVEAFKLRDDYVVGWINDYARKHCYVESGICINHFFPPDIWKKFVKSMENNEKIQDCIMNVNGTTKFIQADYFSQDGILLLKLLIKDIGEDCKSPKLLKEVKKNSKNSALKVKNKKLYNDLFHQDSIGILYVSKDLKLLDCNPFMEDFFGYRKKEIQNKSISTFIHPDDAKIVFKNYEYVINNHKNYSSFTRRYIRKDGTIIWGLIALNGVFNKQGDIEYFVAFVEDYTNQHEAIKKLREQNDILETVFDTVEDFIIYKDKDLKFKACNRSFLDFVNMKRTDVIGKNDYEIYSKEIADEHIKDADEVRKNKSKNTYSRYYEIANKKAYLDVTLKPIFNNSEQFSGLVISAHDVTHLNELQNRQRLIQNMFEFSDEGMVITDNKQNIIALNQAFTAITGYTQEELLGKKPDALASGKHDEKFYKKMWNDINEKGIWRGEIINRKKNGETYPEILTISTIKDENGNIVNYSGIFSDITSIKKSQKELKFLTHYDSLTGLPNKTSLDIRLEEATKRAKRSSQRVAILFIDIDNFKEINDTFGYSIGNKVLIQVAERLKKTLRDTDIISRVGGDEFVVINENLNILNDLDEIVKKIFNIFTTPFIIGKKIFNITCSLGISIYPDNGVETGVLIKNADSAMHEAKKSGKNSHCYYTSDITTALLEKMETLADVRRGIEENEFVVYYQPQIDIKTKKIVGVEALVRWQHATKGLLYPDSFINLAEENGLIIPLGKQVLQQVCTDVKEWIGKGYKLNSGFRAAVNVSAVQIAKGDIFKTIKDIVNQNDLEEKYLEIELTETSIMNNPEEAIKLFKKLSDLGIKLSIDDFGTGYSSLEYLKKFSIHQIKIDRSFICEIPKNKDDIAIAKAVLALGKSMDLEVIAEGVENEVQSDFLIGEGCKKAQGYLYAKALSKEELEDKYLSKMG